MTGRKRFTERIASKYIFILFALIAILFTAVDCASSKRQQTEQERIDAAVQAIRAGQAECIILKEDGTELRRKGGGVSPALYFYDNNRAEMRNATVVDKVVGRAVAAVFISAKVKHVHGLIISEDAIAYLKQVGISSTGNLVVPRILNRKRDGICPMEKSVEGITDPDKAIAAMRAKIAEMQKKKGK